MPQLTDYFSGQQSNDGSLESMCGGFQLTRMQRLYGFGICACLGFTLSILSVLVLWFNRPLFAVLYTFGNITGLIGTGFLIGFAAQCKKMFDASRVWATSIFLISMILTLTVAFTIASVPLYVAFVLAGLK